MHYYNMYVQMQEKKDKNHPSSTSKSIWVVIITTIKSNMSKATADCCLLHRSLYICVRLSGLRIRS